MNIFSDNRIVLTLDAGGTNFVFSAIRGGNEIISPIILNSNSTDLERCFKTIINGFNQLIAALDEHPVAISFAFPGPADYENGIIGNLGNLPSFSGGVALGPMLKEVFGLPTFINNDGNLFTYGEAIAGILPEINDELERNGIERRYTNLFGITLGTGFGAGIVINHTMYRGDTGSAGEIWLMRNFKECRKTAEEGVSVRAIQHSYAKNSFSREMLSPEDIFKIAIGEKIGDRAAANNAFDNMSDVLGESIANALTLLDAPVVVGGGISGASELILPRVLSHLNGYIENKEGQQIPRLISKVYNLEEEASRIRFLHRKADKVHVPYGEKKVTYNAEKKLAIGISRLGTSRAVSIGAYAFALNSMDQKRKANFNV